MNKKLKFAVSFLSGLLIVYLLLLIPYESEKKPVIATNKPFIWDQDHYWESLEAIFTESKNMDIITAEKTIGRQLETLSGYVEHLQKTPLTADDSFFNELENLLFESAARIAAFPPKMPEYIFLQNQLRAAVKEQSLSWDINSTSTKNRLYRLLYGGRNAVDEILLQHDPDNLPDLIWTENETSVTPSSELLGVTIHSGDILVSRGGAPTSALIARGSDYPGNFSHIALVHIDDRTGMVSIIEAHIEIGVAVATIEQYLKDKKHRIMVLRPRHDHPKLLGNPMLPHRAAQYALQKANTVHIPYDFEMDFSDPSRLYCSEVAYAAYHHYGLNLWPMLSNISSEGVAAWLGAFGVTHFQTQEPSDLEYDPQVKVVAEWRNRNTLMDDHIDNAIIDIFLEGAEKGKRIDFNHFLLPLGRLAKAYSVFLNLLGNAGPIPEGMNATSALKNDWLSKKHTLLKLQVKSGIKQFIDEHGYPPPYWEIIKIVREKNSIIN